MTWFKVDDQLHDHRKVRRLGRDKMPAIGLWSLSGSWAADNLTDGFVPAEVVQRWDPSERYAGRLVEAGFWERAEQDGEEGYLFHDWSDHQPTRAEVQAKRETARERMRRLRKDRRDSSEDVRANGKGTSGEVTRLPSRPVPSRPSSSSQSSTKRAVADALGLNEDDQDVTKVIDLIQRENQPSAPGPYIRTLAANGDLPAFLARVRSPTTSTPNATHAFEDDGDGDCRRCPMDRDHPNHDTSTPHLAVVPDSA